MGADGSAALVVEEDLRPAAVRVDPWNYYPDLSASDIAEVGDHFEKHRMNKSQLARLVRMPGFDEEAIERIISAGADGQRDANLDAQRTAAGTVGVDDNRF